MTPEPLYNLAIRLQVYLERVKAGQVGDLTSKMLKTESKLIARIKQGETNLLGDLPIGEFNKLLSDVRKIEGPQMAETSADLMNDYNELTESVVDTETKAMGRTFAAINEDVVRLPAAKAFQAALKNPISATGQLLQPFVDSMGPNSVAKTEAWLRRGYTEGMTTQQVVQGIRGTAARGFKDGITNLKTRQAEAIARTALQHVANTAREATWEANKKFIKGYEWISTLDSATTPQCQLLDKKKFLLGKGPVPPIHIRCRSTTVPDMADGLDFLDEGETRSAAFGPVDSKLSFYDWLKKQDRPYVEKALGKERAAILLDKGLTTKQFKDLAFDKNFKPMTVKSMNAALTKDIDAAPAPTTTSGRIWAHAEKLKATLGRTPTTAELLAITKADGINDATAKTQFARWKKEGSGPTPPKPGPTPPPEPPPVLKPTFRAGMPGSGATRKVWELASELELKLGRAPTRTELLAETRKLGLNDSTAGTQFSKWNKAAPGGTAPTPNPQPRPTPTPSPSAKKTKDEQWAELKAKIDAAADIGPQARPLTPVEIKLKYGADEIQSKWRDLKTGRLRDDTPKDVRDRYAEFLKEFSDAYNTPEQYKATNRTPQILAAIRRPAKDRLKLSVHEMGSGVPTDVQNKVNNALDNFQSLVHPDIIKAMNSRALRVNATADRAHFKWGEYSINLSKSGHSASESTILHEITHAIEYAVPDISTKTRQFLRKRADGEEVEKLSKLTGNPNYRDDEVAWKDKWVEKGGDHYMGKKYIGAPTEILTMGIERLVKDADAFRRKDPEYFEFMVRTLNNL
jgi:SPP1 gp7 family putative phage head morphogenesis protein